MNDNAQKFTALTGVIMLIGASIFYALRSDTAIESSRPQEFDMQTYVPPGYQSKTERLWQDPFEAFDSLTNQVTSETVISPELFPTTFTVAYSTSTNGGTNYYTFGLPANLVTKEKCEANDLRASIAEDKSEMHVLAVMLPGTQLAEDIEARRNTRYAVETALLSSHLAPVDPTHIGASALHLPNDKSQRAQTNLQVAFEWFSSENYSNNTFLVLWLREDDFYFDSLGTLYNVLSFVTTNHSVALCDPAKSIEFKSPLAKPIDFKLIGPVSSDMLQILGSSQLPKSSSNTWLWSKFAIYSPEATAPEPDLWPDKRNSTSFRSSTDRPFSRMHIANALSCTNVQLINWIATDDRLCSNLVRELANRGDGTVLDPNNVIVLVSEADTTFGRSLPITFRNELSRISSYAQIWNFEYLRGLDGSKLPKKREEQPATISSSEASSSDPQALIESALRTPDEQAENDAQLDYAERLSEFLARKDHDLRRTNGAILAVGLLGTDAYDKLILLQALRPRLKEALFFTTDLDARLWMPPKQTGITRNLIVASAYSVEPPIDNYTGYGTFLPFRDVYQTAEFFATRGAVSDSLMATHSEPDALSGHLFEIGRHGPIELQSASEKPASRQWVMPVVTLFTLIGVFVGFGWIIGWQSIKAISQEKVWPWIRRQRKHLIIWLIGIILVIASFYYNAQISRLTLALFIASLGIPLLAVISCGGSNLEQKNLVDDDIQISEGTKAGDGSENNPHAKDKLASSHLLQYLALAFLFCAFFTLLAHYLSSLPGEEPGEWHEGVSIWPTEIIRIVLVILTVGYLIGAHSINERHYRHLWWNYMRDGNYEKIMDEIKSSQSSDKGWNRIRNVLVANWKAPTSGQYKDHVDVRKLLAGYIKRAHSRNRYLRALPLAGSYLLLGFACVKLVNGMPDRLCVRGSGSWMFDNVTLLLSTVSFLIALFLSLDGARLTAKLLDGIGSRPTAWPEKLLAEWSSKSGVHPDHLDGYLDVRFAVDKTCESRLLMFFPFIAFLLLLLSRERYFDNWTWTPELAAVFAFNFLLAGMCWWIVRRSATKIRDEALSKLKDAIKQISGTDHNSNMSFNPAGANCPEGTTFSYRAKDYAKRLKALYKEIEDENRGAFALWIQDPTYLALFLPTGVTGLVVFLLQYWMPHS